MAIFPVKNHDDDRGLIIDLFIWTMIITTFEKDEAMVSDVFIYLNHVYQNMKKAKQGNVRRKRVMDQWSQDRKQKNIHSNGCKMNYK